MDGIAIKGHVTVQVEDKQGNVKQRVEADNALSPAALNALLFKVVANRFRLPYFADDSRVRQRPHRTGTSGHNAKNGPRDFQCNPFFGR